MTSKNESGGGGPLENEAKSRVFISHIAEHTRVAQVLKRWIESSFGGTCSVFVSSSSDDIPLGSDWRTRIDRALDEAAVFLVLCSPASIRRPWINFEVGCGWIKKVPVVPICYGGLGKRDLPHPISRFQALDLEDGSFARQLIRSLSRYLDTPGNSSVAIINELRSAVSGLPSDGSDSSGEEHSGASADLDFLEEDEEQILLLCADHGALTPAELAEYLAIHQEKVKHLCQRLRRADALKFLPSIIGEPSAYVLDDAGREYLVECNLLQ